MEQISAQLVGAAAPLATPYPTPMALSTVNVSFQEVVDIMYEKQKDNGQIGVCIAPKNLLYLMQRHKLHTNRSRNIKNSLDIAKEIISILYIFGKNASLGPDRYDILVIPSQIT